MISNWDNFPPNFGGFYFLWRLKFCLQQQKNLLVYLHVGHLVSVIVSGLSLPFQHCVYLPLTLLWEMNGLGLFWFRNITNLFCTWRNTSHNSHAYLVCVGRLTGRGKQWAECWRLCQYQQNEGPSHTWWAVLLKMMSHHCLATEKRNAFSEIWGDTEALELLLSTNRPYPVHPGSSRQSPADLRVPWSFCARQTHVWPVFYMSENHKRGTAIRIQVINYTTIYYWRAR